MKACLADESLGQVDPTLRELTVWNTFIASLGGKIGVQIRPPFSGDEIPPAA